jgi:hypothetical protein
MASWAEQQARILALRTRLRGDPTNLEVARELWYALGSGDHDLRSGPELVDIFRAPILDNGDNAIVLAQAYKDLARCSGEVPRAELFDPELARALRDAQAEREEESLDWLCRFLSDG